MVRVETDDCSIYTCTLRFAHYHLARGALGNGFALSLPLKYRDTVSLSVSGYKAGKRFHGPIVTTKGPRVTSQRCDVSYVQAVS
jgi:hypothetical protein